VLVGDSVFDNAAYVPAERALASQLLDALPQGCKVTLLAVDGSTARDVIEQVGRLPVQATHIVVSAGGNDALNASDVLGKPAGTVAGALSRLAAIQAAFQRDFTLMLGEVVRLGEPTTVCTIYDAIPGLGVEARTALAIFNDVIFRSAFESKVPVIDLRLVCSEPGDFSTVSPIEPPSQGAQEIATLIAQIAQSHDFAAPRTTVYLR
jgi:hypothetical protein